MHTRALSFYVSQRIVNVSQFVVKHKNINWFLVKHNILVFKELKITIDIYVFYDADTTHYQNTCPMYDNLWNMIIIKSSFEFFEYSAFAD